MAPSTTEGDRPVIDEKKIVVLVNAVRKTQNDSAFEQIAEYLNFYVKLFGVKYKIPGCDSHEIEQECLFALRYKAIEDFNPARGKFRSFAILCIRRHLFSIIKANKQQKRRVLNESLSLDEDHSDDGENLALINLVVKESNPADLDIVREESNKFKKNKLFSRLSKLEKEIVVLYMQQYHYDEIVDELNKSFPNRQRPLDKRTVDNALQRVRKKAKDISDKIDFS